MGTVGRTVLAAALVALTAACAGADATVTVQSSEDEVCAVAGPDGRARVTVGDARVGDRPVQLLRVFLQNGVDLDVVGAAVVVGDRQVPDGFDETMLDAGTEGTLVMTFELYSGSAEGSATGLNLTLGDSIDGDLDVVGTGPRVRVVPAGGSCDAGS